MNIEQYIKDKRNEKVLCPQCDNEMVECVEDPWLVCIKCDPKWNESCKRCGSSRFLCVC